MQIVDILALLVPNVWTAITQLCATAVLFFLMYKLAWKPVRKILDARSAYEQAKLEEAEKLRAENEQIHAQAQGTIDEANKEAEAILNRAREEGQAAKEELIVQGQEESRKLLDKARHELDLQHDKMLEEMHEEIVDAALSVAEKIMQSKIDKDMEKDRVDSFVREVINK